MEHIPPLEMYLSNEVATLINFNLAKEERFSPV